MIQYRLDQLEEFDLPRKTVDYLIKYGVPDNEILLLQFFSTPSWYREGLVKIGVEASVNLLCINNKTGSVVLVNHINATERFVNSNISCLVKCLENFQEVKEKRDIAAGDNDYLDEEVNQKLVKKFEEKLYQTDSALKRAEYFWPLIVEQMEQQML